MSIAYPELAQNALSRVDAATLRKHELALNLSLGIKIQLNLKSNNCPPRR